MQEPSVMLHVDSLMFYLPTNHFNGYTIQAITLHYLGACIGHKTFFPVRKLREDNISHDRPQNRISQKFQAFIVGTPAFFRFDRR
jgi:hypothetical protein